ncbi:MAG: DUF4340 domain-containing protein [Thermodesulfobacteriota bacterium]
MKFKKEYLVLGVVIIALAAYLVLRKTDRTHYRLPEIAPVKSGDITKIEITGAGGRLSAARKENRWIMDPEGFPADAMKINDMLQSMEQFALSARISESKNYERYELGNDKKVNIKIWAGEKISREMDIGSTASTFRHTHVRLEGDPIVYQAQGNLRTKFDVTPDALRDKTVLAFDTQDVTELGIRKDGKTTLLRRKDPDPAAKEDPGKNKGDQASAKKVEPTWEGADGKPAENDKVRRILTTLSALKCQDFIKGAKKEDYKNPVTEITVKGKKELRLLVFQNTDKSAKSKPAVSSESDYPFLLADYVIADFSLK